MDIVEFFKDVFHVAVLFVLAIAAIILSATDQSHFAGVLFVGYLKVNAAPARGMHRVEVTVGWDLLGLGHILWRG